MTVMTFFFRGGCLGLNDDDDFVPFLSGNKKATVIIYHPLLMVFLKDVWMVLFLADPTGQPAYQNITFCSKFSSNTSLNGGEGSKICGNLTM